MKKSIFKGKETHLALKESDVSFFFNKSTRLSQITVNANKVIELRENQLLLKDKLQNYSELWLVHDKKIFKIPITKGSWRYCGQNKGRLRFSVSPFVRLNKKDMHNWHLQLFDK